MKDSIAKGVSNLTLILYSSGSGTMGVNGVIFGAWVLFFYNQVGKKYLWTDWLGKSKEEIDRLNQLLVDMQHGLDTQSQIPCIRLLEVRWVNMLNTPNEECESQPSEQCSGSS